MDLVQSVCLAELMRRSFATQIGFTLVLLAATEAAYRLWPVSGYNEPFVIARNFGSYVDMLLMGKVNPQGWVAINCVPTAAHTAWGVLAGWVLLSDRRPYEKVRILMAAGLVGVAIGYALDPVTPIIKRICTSSFVIVSGGWSLVALAFFYWLVDLRKVRRTFSFAVVVGMNSIFIYLFSQTIGRTWLREFAEIFTSGLSARLSGVQLALATALVVLAIQWWLCDWLYRRRVFIRI